MDKASIGILTVVGIFHFMLVVVPMMNTLRASISTTSKLAWCAFLVLLPFVGVAYFHFRFRLGLFQGKAYQPRPEDLGGPASGFSRKDKDR